MPRIFDNIELPLLPALKETLVIAHRADFCVGYFNLRGWRHLAPAIEEWEGGEQNCCRLLVGMQKAPADEFREYISILKSDQVMDNKTAAAFRRAMAQEFREQLTLGFQTNEDEAGLRQLARQIRQKKLVVKLFLRHTLHAKLYLMHRHDPVNPIMGYMGSSNLTLSGLKMGGELNIDVLDFDAAKKLSRWFEERWNDLRCVDISEELVQIIEESWARTTPIPPYEIYIKIAYHLSHEARAGLSEFRIPTIFGNRLFKYQEQAVKIAARHLHRRGGVLIGDVVGLGKTLIATALAKMFEDNFHLETLILCPKNLVKMWEDYAHRYQLRAKVVSTSKARTVLPDLPRYRLVLLDESHNFRNRDGKTYRAIREYVEKNAEHCILLTATPYNKTYLDLSGQLRLFIPDDRDLGIRPENEIRRIGEVEFAHRHQCSPRSLSAFEKSDFADDWRELMRLFLVRRTRSFIMNHYAQTDPDNGRKFLSMDDGTRSYFPVRQPRTVKFDIDTQYAQLYADDVVDILNGLQLPRYGLGNYEAKSPSSPPTPKETQILKDLSRAGKRLMGFCRTNLFKRLESSGIAFLLSLERHLLRNFIYLHAIENGLPLPIGQQGAEMLDTRLFDEDNEDQTEDPFDSDEEGDEPETLRQTTGVLALRTEADFRRRAAALYAVFAGAYSKRFRWLGTSHFTSTLAKHLKADNDALLKVLAKCAHWEADKDQKLRALIDLARKQHPNQKILVFSQYADTVRYLADALKNAGVTHVEGVTGQSADPTETAWRFSPQSNAKPVSPEQEIRILIASDVLSEGQNLQDAAIVLSYDLPWAIIRLIQRAGRVDRIGQKAETILCYSFLPAEGVNKIIRLRDRLRLRLEQNAEVVGTDEQFFEDDKQSGLVHDLYHEKAGLLDGDADAEVDLSSHAYQIWQNALADDPTLAQRIPNLPPVSYSTRPLTLADTNGEGILVYLQTADGNDALALVDKQGKSLTESQFAILKAAECAPNTPALPRLPVHHTLVKQAVETLSAEENRIGGQLGSARGARRRTYEILNRYVQTEKGGLFATPELHQAIEEIYKFPLTEHAKSVLSTHLKGDISDEKLAELVLILRDDDRLCITTQEQGTQEPRILCSLGISELGTENAPHTPSPSPLLPNKFGGRGETSGEDEDDGFALRSPEPAQTTMVL